MANVQYWDAQSNVNEQKTLFGEVVGNGTGAPTTVRGCVASVSRSDVGDLTITFADSYPKLLGFDFKVTGTSTEKRVRVVESLLTDWASKQIKVEVYNATTDAAVDLTTAETLWIELNVRNSSVGY